MKRSMGLMILCVVLVSASGCMTTVEKAREVAAADLKCDKRNVTVMLEDRIRVGRTRYLSEGCNKRRTYICEKVVWIYGLPVSSARCARERA